MLESGKAGSVGKTHSLVSKLRISFANRSVGLVDEESARAEA